MDKRERVAKAIRESCCGCEPIETQVERLADAAIAAYEADPVFDMSKVKTIDPPSRDNETFIGEYRDGNEVVRVYKPEPPNLVERVADSFKNQHVEVWEMGQTYCGTVQGPNRREITRTIIKEIADAIEELNDHGLDVLVEWLREDVLGEELDK